jgi:hypothetical protein
LGKALAWVNRAMAMDSVVHPEILDTKANILYKLGERTKGLAMEQKSASLAPNNEDIQSNLSKMKNGEPTWHFN